MTVGNIDTSTILVHTELEAAGPYIAGVAETISDELASLITLLTPLAETWAGQAAGQYERLQGEWNVAAAGLFGPEGVLGQISAALNVNWGNYSDAEWANVQTWQH